MRLTPSIETQSSPGLDGWRLVACLSVCLLLMAAAALSIAPLVEGTRLVIRLTARTSLTLFLLAFTASAVALRWPGTWTRWQLRNRRHLGLCFAVSHAIHLAAIVTFWQTDPVAFQGATNLVNLVTGGLAYAFIAAMCVTSFDVPAAWLGARAWRLLHAAGMYYLWVSFVFAFGKRIPMAPAHALPVAVLVLALVLRLRRQRPGRRQAAVPAASLR